MKSRKKRISIFVAICLSLGFSVMVVFTTLAKKYISNEKTFLQHDELIKNEAVKVVKDYWRFSEEGNYLEAGKLRTNKRKGFTFIVENSPRKFEESIYKTGYTFISIEQIEVVDDNEYEIAVKVKNKQEREFYLFHTIVKTKMVGRFLALHINCSSNDLISREYQIKSLLLHIKQHHEFNFISNGRVRFSV